MKTLGYARAEEGEYQSNNNTSQQSCAFSVIMPKAAVDEGSYVPRNDKEESKDEPCKRQTEQRVTKAPPISFRPRQITSARELRKAHDIDLSHLQLNGECLQRPAKSKAAEW
eukprot:TRINITY_DN522_c0_g1_i2.p2 TRINITY_DN522_c0_g1~~TRINITY_DN522_c0_g1_i2.p2  ORF type:complete len:112 (-),score=14.75 TRINITY_DN522_c0_g1_i2:356-691(-)